MSIVIHERTRSGNTEERSCDEFIDAVPHAQEQSSSGRVYLVGAGPGDPELITLKALRCLRMADVVVYDRLISPCLLDEARSEAERDPDPRPSRSPSYRKKGRIFIALMRCSSHTHGRDMLWYA